LNADLFKASGSIDIEHHLRFMMNASVLISAKIQQDPDTREFAIWLILLIFPARSVYWFFFKSTMKKNYEK